MDQLERWAFAGVFYLSLFSPLLLIPLLCKRLISQPKDNYSVAIATTASLSYVFLLTALLYKATLLGADYSGRLFTTVEANTALTLLLATLATFRKTAVRGFLAFSAFTISLAWFLVWVVNAAV